MMYCTFATLFIAQVYGIQLTIGQQITMLLLLMVTSKGMAGVPRASLVVIAATLAFFNLPEAGPAADPGRRPPARHGPLGHQRGRQFGGRRRGRQVGAAIGDGGRGRGGAARAGRGSVREA